MKARACILTAESESRPPPSGWTLQECCELMDEARWEQERGGVRDRDREL